MRHSHTPSLSGLAPKCRSVRRPGIRAPPPGMIGVMSTSADGPLSLPLDASPAVLLGLAVERWGARGLMDRCVRLYREMDWGEEPELMTYLAGGKGQRWVELGFGVQDYFVRTWALRAMLYAWDRSAEPTVILALQDKHWRPREMAPCFRWARPPDLRAQRDAMPIGLRGRG